MNDVTGRVTKQSSQQQCGVLRSSRTRPYLSVRRFNTTTERSGLLPLRLPSDTKEISRTRLMLRLRRRVRSPRLGSMIPLLSPLAQGTKSRRSTAIFRARCVVPEAINAMANKTSPFDHDAIDSAPQFYSCIGLS